jgi:hypothetical protein
MNTHPAEDDARSLWRGQDLPPLQPLPPQQLAAQAAKLQAAVSRRNRRELVAAALVALVFMFYAWFFPHWLTRLGALLCVAGAGVTAWQLRRRASARPLPPDLAGSLLAFHRRELARQRVALQSVWRWHVGPLVPGLLLFLSGRQIENGRWQPGVFVITAVVLAGVLWINRRAARALQRQIDALDELNKETP